MTSTGCPWESESGSVEAEKLRRYSMTGVDFWRRRICVSESVTYQRFAQIQGQREVVTSLHWPVQDLGTERRGSLPARATCTAVRCAQRVSHIIVEEVFEGTRGTVATGGVECMWQNRLNYSGSSAQTIAIQATGSQWTSNETTHWSVGSPPDSTTVTQDRRRFTSHEGKSSLTTARNFYTIG
jgi:hypothetical protein